jgi:hypothetical protein
MARVSKNRQREVVEGGGIILTPAYFLGNIGRRGTGGGRGAAGSRNPTMGGRKEGPWPEYKLKPPTGGCRGRWCHFDSEYTTSQNYKNAS